MTGNVIACDLSLALDDWWSAWLAKYQGGPFDEKFELGMTVEPIPRATGRWVIDDLYGVVMRKPRRRKRTTERKERG